MRRFSLTTEVKKIIVLHLFCLLTIANIYAQAPEKMSYQAVIRDANNNLVTNQAIGMQISILEGSANGTTVYVETQNPSTNANGLVSLEIGNGAVVSGDLSMVDWSSGAYFLKTETDPTGGNNYTISGTSQLLSVPYALYAESSGSSTPGPQGERGPEGPQGPQGEQGEPGVGLPTMASNGNLVTYDGTNWVAKTAVISNTGGGQSVNNMMPYQVVHYIICLQGVFPSRNTLSGQDGMIGEIRMFGGNFAPRTWAFCNGQLLAINSNQALFSILGTTYGGDGRTTFGLPDFRGRTALSAGTGPGLSTRSLGQKSGTETNTLSTNQLPSHSHTIIYQ